jgi:brefeldin A-resistance guanine nucleotide exchange factor 1
MPEPSSSPTLHVPVWPGYGIGCATEVLEFIVGLVGAPGMEADDIRVFGLELINIALSSGRDNFMHHEVLMEILQTELFQAMHRAARSGNLAALSGSCSVTLSLYVYLGRRMLLQLEAFIGGVLLRIAGGKGCSYKQQETALEGILDLCHQAAFVRDAYANLDCRIERSNVFEDICALLSRTAFPINCPLCSIHLISLEGLLAVLNTLSSRVDSPGEEEDVVLSDSGVYTDIWTSLVEGREPLIPIPGTSRQRMSLRSS